MLNIKPAIASKATPPATATGISDSPGAVAVEGRFFGANISKLHLSHGADIGCVFTDPSKLYVRAVPEKAESGDSHRSANMIQASYWREASMDGEAAFGGFA